MFLYQVQQLFLIELMTLLYYVIRVSRIAQLDFWKEPGRLGDHVTILTPPHLHHSLLERLSARALSLVVNPRNIQEYMCTLYSTFDLDRYLNPVC